MLLSQIPVGINTAVAADTEWPECLAVLVKAAGVG